MVSLLLSNPTIVAEFEKEVDRILVSFGVQDQTILEILNGHVEPSGLLPFQMPANMITVEEQLEDIAHDMNCHADTVGHAYDFGYGLNWDGQIKDQRTSNYARKIDHLK